MLQDCLEIFEKRLNQGNGDRLILDAYTPKDGTYRIILIDDDKFEIKETVEVKTDKKSNETISSRMGKVFDDIKFYDYNSKLLEMNKSIDSSKVIHSNNYLSFAIKKTSMAEEKVKNEIIERYYETLKNPLLKYKKGNATQLYKKIEEKVGPPDNDLIDKIKDYILKGTYFDGIDSSKKDYLKIFFVFQNGEETKARYVAENERYIVPNIYNNNDFNIEGDEILGLPNDNMGMNVKKPYLANKNRKVNIPYVLNQDEAILQGQFFDYLYGNAAKGRMNVYISKEADDEKITFYSDKESPKNLRAGYYLRLMIGKTGAEIHDVDVITDYNEYLKCPMLFNNIIGISDEYLKESKLPYGEKLYNLWEIKSLVDSIYFQGRMSTNFYTDAKDIKWDDNTIKRCYLESRDALHRWFYLGQLQNVAQVLDRISIKLIINSASNGKQFDAQRQFNLRWSMIDYFNGNRRMEEKMGEVREKLRHHLNQEGEWDIENSDEYAYALGQAVSYLIGRSQAGKKPSSRINEFLNVNDSKRKTRLMQLYKRYNYDIDHSRGTRINKLFSHIFEYKPVEPVSAELIVAGFTAGSLIYEKKEADKQGGEKDDE